MNRYIILLITVVVATTFFFIAFKLMEPTAVCGNEICEKGETFTNCCVDCGCPPRYECKNKVCIRSEVVTTTTISKTTTIFPSAVCGNDVCESGENCYDCSKDCKCEEGEYCSSGLKKCALPECGNDLCEPFESPYNCCDDCECTIPGEFCNLAAHECETPEVDITDERIEECVIDYYQDQNKTVASIEILNIFEWEGKIGKRVRVFIEGEFISEVLVTAEEEVIELPIL